MVDRVTSANHPDLARSALPDPTAPTAVPRALLWWLTAGVAGTALFTITYLIEGATRPGYDGWTQAISALSLGPGGWLQRVNFFVIGGCVLVLATVWRRVLKGGAGGVVYPFIRGVEALGFIAAGAFSQDPAPGYPPGARLSAPTVHGEIHIISAYVIVSAMTAGLLIFAWRFARDHHWWGWAAYSALSAILTLVFMALFGMAQHGGDAGLYERLATNIETVWGVALLASLWAGMRIMRTGA